MLRLSLGCKLLECVKLYRADLLFSLSRFLVPICSLSLASVLYDLPDRKNRFEFSSANREFLVNRGRFFFICIIDWEVLYIYYLV